MRAAQAQGFKRKPGGLKLLKIAKTTYWQMQKNE
jgi:hypothetical protein